MGKQGNEADGFSMIEVVIVLALSLVVAAIAIPSAQKLVRSYRLLGDSAALASQSSLARIESGIDLLTESNHNYAANVGASVIQ